VGDNPSVSANLDLVRSIYAATERGDYSSAEWADPNIVYMVADGPEPGTWKGLTEMARGMGQILGAWEEVRTKVDEYRELDDERVLVLLHHGGRGKSSGLELDALSTRGADIVYVRAGKVTKVVKYYDRDRALAELGLASEADSP
jgi:ketosteroid isomerase-like protein